MVAFKSYRNWIGVLTIFLTCSANSMDKQKEVELSTNQSHGPPKMITIGARNPSPKSAQVLIKVQSPSSPGIQKQKNEAVNPSGSKGKSSAHAAADACDNADSKHCCEVRVSCCQKIMKCSGLTLAAALVATTGAIAYYLHGLDDTCSKLIAPIESIDNSIKEGIQEGMGFAQMSLAFANQSLLYLQGFLPDSNSLYNATFDLCLNAQRICQNADYSCNHPLGS